jgi:hypothetical protein
VDGAAVNAAYTVQTVFPGLSQKRTLSPYVFGITLELSEKIICLSISAVSGTSSGSDITLMLGLRRDFRTLTSEYKGGIQICKPTSGLPAFSLPRRKASASQMIGKTVFYLSSLVDGDFRLLEIR